MYIVINKRIIIDIPFNIDFRGYYPNDMHLQGAFNASFERSQTKAWIDYRIDIFMKYTAASLMNQTDQSFLCMVRYNLPTEKLIFEALARHPKLTDNIIFTTRPDEVREEAMKGYNYLYNVIIDSDNMYSSDFIEKINKFEYEEGLECLMCEDGYMYDVDSDRLAWIHHTSPSFYVYIYSMERYKTHFKAELFESHMIATRHKYKVVPGNNYCIITHQANADNWFDGIVHWLNGRYIINEDEKNEVLKKWKIK